MPDVLSPPQPRPNRRPRLRFTLRLLIAFVTLLCIALGIWTHRAREQRRLVDAIRRSGGNAYYDYQSWGTSPIKRQSRLSQWLLNQIGADYFHDITAVTVVEL